MNQPERDDDGRNLHHGEKRWKEPFVGDVSRVKESNGGGEGNS